MLWPVSRIRMRAIKIHNYIRLKLLICVLLLNLNLYGQDKEQIYIRNADLARAETRTLPPQTSYIGNVQAFHKGAFIFCDNAVLKENVLYANGSVSIIQNDTVEVYADTLIYDGNQDLAYLIGEVILINGDDTLYTQELEYSTASKQARYTLRAYMKTGKTVLKSQTGSYDTQLKEAWFYDKVSIESDSLYITTDSLRYNTAEDESFWKSPAIVKSGKTKLYSQQGTYNSKTKRGIFEGNAQYQEDSVLATADTMIIDNEQDIFYLKGNAVYYSISDSAEANTIYFNKSTDSISLQGQAIYAGRENNASGDSIFYNKSSGDITVSGKSVIQDKGTTLKGDNVKYDKKSKSGYAVGNVIYSDTLENVKLWADTLEFNGDTKFILARSVADKQPVYATNQDGDSLYITGKTLNSYTKVNHKTSYNAYDSLETIKNKVRYSVLLDSLDLYKLDPIVFKDQIVTRLVQKGIITISIKLDSLSGESYSVSDTNAAMKYINKFNSPDTIQYLMADKNVVVYKSDMQMKADSLFFNGTDSVFTLFKNPVIWSDSTQMTADTIELQLKDKKISSLQLTKNGYILSTDDFKFYNQIKGRKIDGYFENGKMSSLKTDGNAQLVYYLKDDKDQSYMGVNTTDASSFNFIFKNGKIKEIRHFGNPQSKILPMKGTDHNAIRLEGFNALFENRPSSVNDVFTVEKNTKPRETEIPKETLQPEQYEIDKVNEKFIKKNR